MDLTRQEVNLRRLLAKCELLIKNRQRDESKFAKYITSLEEMLEEVREQRKKTNHVVCSSSPPNEHIPDYMKRIHNLKFQLGLLSADELALGDPGEKSKEINPREELFEMRKRNVANVEGQVGLEQVINFHQNMHEKIAEDMLTLTKNLKEQSTLANKIIKKDTEVVSRSTQLTDKNFFQLKVESERLTEHSRKAWKCWMWIMLLIVLVVFINMVLFMKVVKKKY